MEERVRARGRDDAHFKFDPMEIEILLNNNTLLTTTNFVTISFSSDLFFAQFLNNNKRKSREMTEGSPTMTNVSSELHVQKVHKMGLTEGACSTGNAGKDIGEDSIDSDKTAKLRLFDICCTNKWNCPVYELCEVGSGQNNMFTYKVTVLIDTYSLTVLEAFSAPHCQREAAQVHAAEGALWYLKHLGYCS